VWGCSVEIAKNKTATFYLIGVSPVWRGLDLLNRYALKGQGRDW
jgi:hypothetical protein